MSVESNLWHPPATPHAFDDEFNGSSIDAKWLWTQSGGGVLTPELVTAPSFTAELDWPEVRANVGQRASWLRIQPGAHASNLAMMYYAPDPGVILPDGFYWCRAAPNWHIPAVNSAASCYLALKASQAADPVLHGTRIGINLDSGPSEVQRSHLEYQGGGATENEESADLESRGEPHEFWGIRKTGNVYESFSANAAGQWMRFFSSTYGGGEVIDCIALIAGSSSKTNGSEVQGFDFIRYRADGELP